MKTYYKKYNYKVAGKLEREVLICAQVTRVKKDIPNKFYVWHTIGRVSHVNIIPTKDTIKVDSVDIDFGFSIRRLEGPDQETYLEEIGKSIAKGRAESGKYQNTILIDENYYSKEVLFGMMNRIYRNVIRDVINKLKD